MRVKRYRAPDMYQAFKRIRDELGPEAIIIESRKVRPKGFAGFLRRPELEVLAAVDTDLKDVPPSRSLPANPLRQGDKVWGTALVAALQSQPRLDQILEHLTSIQESVESLNQGASRQGAAQPSHSVVIRLRAELLARGMEAELAEEVIHAALAKCQPNSPPTQEQLTAAIKEHLKGLLTTSGPLEVLPGKAKVLFLVGPTGVGKTTTLAKLAAGFAHKERKRVLLASMDTFRVGAMAQLKSYARLLHLPVRVAYSPQELSRLEEERANWDLILIDSPGCSPRNVAKIEELSRFIQALPQAEVHLALNPGLSCQDLKVAFRNFSYLPIQKLLLTKLDEAASAGGVFTLARQAGMPISYLTTGQKVPEDIEVATPERILDFAFIEECHLV